MLLGRSHSGASFQDVFLISLALSLIAVLQSSNITPGESEARVVGRNTRQKRDNQKKLEKPYYWQDYHISTGVFVSKNM